MGLGQSVMPLQCCAGLRRQSHVRGLLIIVVIWFYLLLIVFKKSFYKQLPKCVEAIGGGSVARRPRAVPAQYLAPFVPGCFLQAQGVTVGGSCNPEGTTSYCDRLMVAS